MTATPHSPVTSSNPWEQERSAGSPPPTTTAPPAAAAAPATTPPATTTAATPPAAAPDLTQVEPRLAPLLAMFPGMDIAVLESVLDSVRDDQDRAIDILLGMTDPNYVSETPAPRPAQGESDEDMARRLAAEEEYSAAWYPQPAGAPAAPGLVGRGRGGMGNINPPPPIAGSSDGTNNDTFAQVQDQVMKFAETGKRTFLSFASKVKQKLQELDNSSAMPRHRDWNDPTYPNEEPAAETHPHMYENRVTPQYVAPPGQRYPQSSQPAPAVAAAGYDVDSHAAVAQEQPKPTTPIAIPAPATSSPPTSSSPAPASYDASRLGLLPKRPVSLIDTSAPPKKTTHDDDDDLEYVENPFDDKQTAR